ncbi:MAG: 3-isopropylmalate dehydratase small subunit [archaeon]
MGRVWKLGDNINTDQIIPARYYPTTDLKSLGKKCLCELREDISGNIKEGDIILGGNNFGCGSSREYAPIAIKHSGAKCVIAKSFARIFYRNSINIGLPIILSSEAYDFLNDGDNVEVDLLSGKIRNLSSKKEMATIPLPDFVLKIVKEGGIINFIKSSEFSKYFKIEKKYRGINLKILGHQKNQNESDDIH